MKRIAVIGSGFSGISAACELASKGCAVDVFEKNESIGGRASVFRDSGFMFDMGPSWYWMPDVFEWFFAKYGKHPKDYYELVRVSPSYRVFFDKNSSVDVPADVDSLCNLFEEWECGSAEKLREFLRDAEYKYSVGVKELIYQPCNSVFEFVDSRMLKALFSIQLFTSLRKEIESKFSHPYIKMLLEFPSYFLGALPNNTPALYSILNYADIVLGTWYPMGGFGKVIDGMASVATEQGVKFHCNAAVTKIINQGNGSVSIVVNGETHTYDGVVSSADYEHTERMLLTDSNRNYKAEYWDTKVFAPSCIIFYCGIKGKVKNLLHHNLFFDTSFEEFARDIYTTPQWSENPLFYTCVPSKTDSSVAPDGDENVFILVPVAPGLTDTEEIRSRYFDAVIARLESHTGESIRERIYVKHTFAPQDFVRRYNSYKGNAYGLANTLFQTAVFKPKLRNKSIPRLVYAGQLTVPGPGVPPSIISGHVAANELLQHIS